MVDASPRCSRCKGHWHEGPCPLPDEGQAERIRELEDQVAALTSENAAMRKRVMAKQKEGS